MAYEAVILTPSLLNAQPDILAGIARVHASCILLDGTLASFLPPLNPDTLCAWWTARWEEAQRGERAVIVVLADPSATALDAFSQPPTSSAAIDALPGCVAGVVSLALPTSQTGPFRALVEKFFVSPAHRRRGLGRALLAKLEAVARDRGRTSLLLDTTVGTPAEAVYPRLGYRRLGVVERYGIHPLTGELVDEVWFWKDLNVDPLL